MEEERARVHWLDILVVIVMGFGTYIGSKRGLMLELTDWCIMIFASLAAFRGFRPLGAFLHRMIPAWPLPNCETIAFWFLLLVVGVGVLTVGLHADRATREFDRIPPEVRQYGGLTVAFFKCLVLACVLAATLPYSSGLSSAEKKAAKKSASATALRSVSGPVALIVGIVTPEDYAKKFRDALR